MMYLLPIFLLFLGINKVYSDDNGNCPPDDQWACDNGDCIDKTLLCDGSPDCRDQSDETIANCIDKRQLCIDNSYTFNCAYGACVAGNAKCNGIKDCIDNSDEEPALCKEDEWRRRISIGCPANNFKCDDGTCVDSILTCDGNKDCPDGSDETLKMCAGVLCDFYKFFRCGYGGCIAGNNKCDGNIDCADGSDEESLLCNGTRIRNQIGCRVPEKPLITLSVRSSTTPLLPGSIHGNKKNVKFRCEHGYTLKQTDDLFTCEGTQWDRELPICFRNCTDKLPKSGYTTKVTFEHPDYPADYSQTQFVLGTKAKISCAPDYFEPVNYRPKEITCLADGRWSDRKQQCYQFCGRHISDLIPFTTGGKDINITSTPWHVTIFEQEQFICAGTLISARLVLSAEHCFWKRGEKTTVDKIKVAGGLNFQDFNAIILQEKGVDQIHDVKEIFEHPRNIKFDYITLRHDIAIVKLKTPFIFSPAVRPICLNFHRGDEKTVSSNITGNLVAWQTGALNKLQLLPLTTLSYRECKQRSQATSLYAEKFCVMLFEGTNICKGDSGSGFFIQDYQDEFEYGSIERKKRNRLLGIISASPSATNNCSSEGFVYLTNIEYYQDWIEMHMNQEYDEFESDN